MVLLIPDHVGSSPKGPKNNKPRLFATFAQIMHLLQLETNNVNLL